MQVARNWREEKEQVLRLCEHILYPTAKTPLALCNEVLILASSSSVHAFIHTDGLSTLVRLPRRTKQIVLKDNPSVARIYTRTNYQTN